MQLEPGPTRKEFLMALAAAPLAKSGGKALIVVAHPDDEYAVAASTYHLARESGWTVDQVVITDGVSGYRYAALAEVIYGVRLEGEERLASIRRRETLNAGKVLGIRHHHFLEQRDSGFESEASTAESGNWDRPRVLAFLTGLMRREEYDVIFTMLPTRTTHGHHVAAARLALEAAAQMPEESRPAVLGAEPVLSGAPPEAFSGRQPVLLFDRQRSFGYHSALNYQIVVNWMIAEHKSQGLFQTDSGRHDREAFWLLAEGGGPRRRIAYNFQ